MCVAVAAAMYAVISHSRLGMRVRAGSSNREMVESLGIKLRLHSWFSRTLVEHNLAVRRYLIRGLTAGAFAAFISTFSGLLVSTGEAVDRLRAYRSW